MLINPAKALEASSILGVKLEGLTLDEVNKKYRHKAKQCHPDYHGNKELELWSRVSWAKECLTFWVEQHPTYEEPTPEEYVEGDCRACGGTGRMVVARTSFGLPLTTQCVICRGLGIIIVDEDDHD